MHVMTLVRADPDVVGYMAAGQIRRKLGEVDNISHPRGVALYILIRNEGVVLAFIKLVTACMIQWSDTKRIRLHIRLPSFMLGIELIDDVRHVDRSVVVIGDTVRRARGCGDVVWLTGMRHTKVVGC